MRKSMRYLTVFAVIAACTGGPATLHGARAAEESTAPAEVRLTENQIRLIELQTVLVAPGRIVSDLVVNGEVMPDQDRTVDVVPRVGGTVREVPRQLGDAVQAGATLAIIESSEIASAEAAYHVAFSKAELARSQLNRETSLWKRKISSEQDYQAARQAAAEADIELRASERKLTLFGVDVKALPAGAAASDRGPVRVAVTAPIDGTLIEKRVAVGNQVTDASPLFRVANLDRVWVIASVFERDMGSVAIGQTAEVTVAAYPGRTFEGRVTWIADIVDEKTRTLKVRVEVGNKDRALRPGSFARVAIGTSSQREVLAVPTAAVQRQKAEQIVFVVAGDGVFKRREVTLGARSRETVEILSGLEQGDTVVSNGSFTLKSELEKAGFADSD
jgi:cobalt-zinc-cadmium efflux system membrane fusion protein